MAKRTKEEGRGNDWRIDVKGMSIKERVLYVVSLLRMTENEFEAAVGWPRGYISQSEEINNVDDIVMIGRAFPAIDPAWFLSDSCSLLCDPYDGKDLDMSVGYPVPLIPPYAQRLGVEKAMQTIPQGNVEWVVSPFEAAQYAVPVRGNSMWPEYPEGSLLYVKRFDDGDFIEWGSVYMLDTTGGILVKELRKTDNENVLGCYSTNPDPKYDSFMVSKKYVLALYVILGVLIVK